MTVEINTITRVLRQDICMSCNGRRHDYPRSIVTDHYLLGPMLIISPKILEEGTLDPANKLQASSSKQRLTMVQG